MERGIERIILVYDMDDLDGDKAIILKEKDLKSKINNLEQIFKRIGYNVEICYIPVVYAAETLMLYQYLGEKYGIRIYNLVSSVNTWELHLCLLAYLVNEWNTKRAKKIRNFLEIDKLVESFSKATNTDINYTIKKWIVEGCNLDSKDIFCGYDALDHLKETEERFNRWKADSDRTISIDEHNIKLNQTVRPLLTKPSYT